MFRNKLKRLEARVFGGLSSLVELDLKYNEISEVDPLAFDGLPHLTIVYLSFNRLRVLPAHMFMGAPNLVTVDLSQNQLVTLTWRTVQDLRKIDAESFDMSLTALQQPASFHGPPVLDSRHPQGSHRGPGQQPYNYWRSRQDVDVVGDFEVIDCHQEDDACCCCGAPVVTPPSTGGDNGPGRRQEH
ncbi:hypothetical protein HPB47_014948 [Ixodes persulcatus]|uniref:Uncharacterized protein n=1 Tax=Ixodes persulcatus TaxID=34615 RepID=A0AC60QV11_IXOPE|nr:hypothetical protein HPB47_014948 [Ixodes persulcatus]